MSEGVAGAMTFSPKLERPLYPNKEKIVAAVRKVLH